MIAIADVVTGLDVVSGTLLIVDCLEGGGVAATSDQSGQLEIQDSDVADAMA